MAYNPISGTVPQYSTANNELASGYYLKFYATGTTTPLSMATDSAAGTLLAKAKLNPSGMPISNPVDNDSVFIPFMNADYRVVLYKNEADADADTTGSAEFNVNGMPYEVGDASTASTAVTVHDTTLQALSDYDRSPLFVDGTDFTAGAPPHVITIASDRNPGAALTRYWKMSADGTIAAAVVSARSSTSVTVNESLLSTDTIFMGDDTNRNIHDGDPADIRTRISVYSTTEADAVTDLKLVKTANLSDLASAATARTNLDVYSKAESDSAFLEDGTGTVDATNLASNSVTTAKILDANVTTAKILDANVTAPKLAATSSEDAWVGARVAGLAYAAVGTYAILYYYAAVSRVFVGGSVAGSDLRYGISTGTEEDLFQTKYISGTLTALSGTWRYCGQHSMSSSPDKPAGLFVRIA